MNEPNVTDSRDNSVRGSVKSSPICGNDTFIAEYSTTSATSSEKDKIIHRDNETTSTCFETPRGKEIPPTYNQPKSWQWDEFQQRGRRMAGYGERDSSECGGFEQGELLEREIPKLPTPRAIPQVSEQVPIRQLAYSPPIPYHSYSLPAYTYPRACHCTIKYVPLYCLCYKPRVQGTFNRFLGVWQKYF